MGHSKVRDGDPRVEPVVGRDQRTTVGARYVPLPTSDDPHGYEAEARRRVRARADSIQALLDQFPQEDE